jgi:ABC-2 type transport system ATP-binding protein
MLKMMATYLPLTSGRIEIAGIDVARESLAARERLGYLPEHNALFESMRVDRFLAFIAQVRGLGGPRARERTAWVLDRCGLEPVIARKIRDCSKGFRQRIGLAAALLHDPPVLLLDEPTHGLDPIQVVAFRELVRELSPGRAILFSSHILAEVATISDRLLVIQGGRLVLDERVSELTARALNQHSSLEVLVLEAVRTSGSAGIMGALA